MSKRARFGFLVLSVLTFVAAAKLYADVNPASAATARRLVREFQAQSGVPGLSVAVGVHGEIVWEEAFGSRDLESGMPATTETLFRLGSVSKLLTIAAMARIQERGKLDLDKPLGNYLPSLPDDYKAITSRQLAGHLGGVRHYLPKDFSNDAKYFNTVPESIQIFTGDPLVNPPGTQYVYSSFGYVLLSAVLEAAAGKEFLKILDEEVLQPLKLKHSGADLVREILPGRTRYYERGGGRIRHAPHEDPSYKWAGGGLISSASDVVRFGMAHLKSGYLQSETLKALFTSQSTADGKETGVGLGWRIGTDPSGRRVYHHAGNISGGRAVLVLYPDEGLAVSMLSNLSGEPPFAERTAMMVARPFLSSNESTSIPADFSGFYELTGSHSQKPYSALLEVEKENGHYGGQITGDFPLLSIAEKNGMPAITSVTDIFSEGQKTIIVLASPFGLIDLVLQPQEGAYTCLLDVGPMKIEGILKKKAHKTGNRQ